MYWNVYQRTCQEYKTFIRIPNQNSHRLQLKVFKVQKQMKTKSTCYHYLKSKYLYA